MAFFTVGGLATLNPTIWQYLKQSHQTYQEMYVHTIQNYIFQFGVISFITFIFHAKIVKQRKPWKIINVPFKTSI